MAKCVQGMYVCTSNLKERYFKTVPPDLLIYALIAAGLIFWLRNILGTNDDDTTKKPGTPYLAASAQQENNVLPFDNRQNNEATIGELAKTPKGNMAISSGTNSEAGLIDIARFDKSFEIISFMRAAQDAFVFVVESFADGDRETLKDLLSPPVFTAFDMAISARENAGEVMKTEIRGIKLSEILEAKLEGPYAKVTIRFIAEETTFTKNASGEIIFGHEEKITQMRDIWTFSRDLRSRDPRWLVIETREDIDDNQTIPNAH